jgi:Tfp pilus assembly protein PilX
MKALRSEQGVALVAAVLIMSVMSGLGLGLLLLTNNQQKAAGREQASESAFTVAEAALNAQVTQLSREWPASEKIKEEEALPERCTATTTTSKNGCPDALSLKEGYSGVAGTCPSGAPKDAWGGSASNEWTTYVRDDVEGTGKLFNSTSEAAAETAHWDKNGDNMLWVRSVGIVQCRMVVLVTLVSRQLVALNFPRNGLTANWFDTTNKGKHSGPIIERKPPTFSEAGPISMRCENPPHGECEKYREGQIEPPPGTNEPSPSVTLNESQLEALKQQAKSIGEYYPTGTCPSGIPPGLPAYVEGPCNVEEKGNAEVNSKAQPGFLVIVNGTFSIGGGAVFYGVVYAANKQGSKESVVNVEGNAKIIGAIDVDGEGGIEIGSSGNKTNFSYDPSAINEVKAYAGAAATRNSFRILSNNE